MMFLLRITVMALRSLRIHPLRTILATLGVIIGVAAVVAAMSILEGTRTEVEGRFAVPGFGTFDVKTRAARKGRNPKTGEEIDIPASKTVAFKPAGALKDKVK